MNNLLLFDIDGTLLRGAGPDHKNALIAGAHSVIGVRCTLDGVDTSGQLDRDLLTAMLTNAGVAKRRISANLRDIMEASQKHYSDKCRVDLSTKVCPGVRETLEMLVERGVPMGVVTGNLSAIAWRKLELARLNHYFSFGAFAEQARSRARLALIASWQARRSGLIARGGSVTLVGDHANDVCAAQANGFRSVAVATGAMQSEQLKRFRPDVILQTLEGASLEVLCGS